MGWGSEQRNMYSVVQACIHNSFLGGKEDGWRERGRESVSKKERERGKLSYFPYLQGVV